MKTPAAVQTRAIAGWMSLPTTREKSAQLPRNSLKVEKLKFPFRLGNPLEFTDFESIGII
jgi:hypothetical protein